MVWFKLKTTQPTVGELCDVTYDDIKKVIITIHSGWTWNGKCFEKNGDFLEGVKYWVPTGEYDV